MTNTCGTNDVVVAVILDDQPKGAAVLRDADEFDAFGEHFREVVGGLHDGFYDFLRSAPTSVVGIRFIPIDEAANVLRNTISQGRNLRLTRDGLLDVWLIMLDEGSAYRTEISCDQYFGHNRLFRSAVSGRLAITFAVVTTNERPASRFAG